MNETIRAHGNGSVYHVAPPSEAMMRAFSDDMLARCIARLEGNPERPGAGEALEFARAERARRHPDAATQFAADAPQTSAPQAAAAPRDETDMSQEEADRAIAQAEGIAARAKDLMAEAEERGKPIDLEEAVRLAKAGDALPDNASDEDRAQMHAREIGELVTRARAAGFTLTHAEAADLAKVSKRHPVYVAFQARLIEAEHAARGQYLHTADAVRIARDRLGLK